MYSQGAKNSDFCWIFECQWKTFKRHRVYVQDLIHCSSFSARNRSKNCLTHSYSHWPFSCEWGSSKSLVRTKQHVICSSELPYMRKQGIMWVSLSPYLYTHITHTWYVYIVHICTHIYTYIHPSAIMLKIYLFVHDTPLLLICTRPSLLCLF